MTLLLEVNAGIVLVLLYARWFWAWRRQAAWDKRHLDLIANRTDSFVDDLLWLVYRKPTYELALDLRRRRYKAQERIEVAA